MGADGLITIEKDVNNEVDFIMHYYNGLLGDEAMCGNGARCAVSFAKKCGYFENKKNDEIKFQAQGKIYKGKFIGDEVSIYFGDISFGDKYKNGYFIDTGCPHYVEIKNEDIDDFDLIPYAKEIRYSDDFPNGTNVNIVFKDSDVYKIRTYERGVEDETFACGTGAVALACVLGIDLQNDSKNTYKIKARGGELFVSLKKTQNNFTDVWLTGPAVVTFEGIIEV